MSSDFTGSGSLGDDSARLGCKPRLSSQRFDSARFETFSDCEWMREGGSEEDSPSYGGGYMEQPEAISDGADFPGILPPSPEGFALTEWTRQNVIRLEEKGRKEKEMLKIIMNEADEYKADYYKKWKIRCENNRAVNRENEKLFDEGRDKFQAEADKSYWKAIDEVIPKEVAVIQKKGKKESPSVVVIKGPKPGKPTDLSRMRRILVKLKHEPPRRMV